MFKKICLLAFLLVSAQRVLAAASMTINADEKKYLIEMAKAMNDGNDFPGIDVKKGTVDITGEDELRASNFQKFLHDQNDLGSGIYGSYNSFTKNCEATPNIEVDMAVFKTVSGNLQPTVHTLFEGLGGSCSNPPNAKNKAFVKSLKTIHFKLTGAKCKMQSYGTNPTYELTRNGDVLTVGFARDYCSNVPDSVERWMALQKSGAPAAAAPKARKNKK